MYGSIRISSARSDVLELFDVLELLLNNVAVESLFDPFIR